MNEIRLATHCTCGWQHPASLSVVNLREDGSYDKLVAPIAFRCPACNRGVVAFPPDWEPTISSVRCADFWMREET